MQLKTKIRGNSLNGFLFIIILFFLRNGKYVLEIT